MSVNGAEALLRTLVASGVGVCFGNPGTSEMHLLAALDRVPGMRAVLGLSEGTVTGAADGYGRMAGRPAATLLHLGPGLGNGFANLHNARRARTPVVNLVGDHAGYHLPLDAPLTSDLDGLVRALEGWARRIDSVADVGPDTAAAVAAAAGPPGRSATLVVPADVSWSEGGVPGSPRAPQAPDAVGEDTLGAVAQVLRSGEPVGLLLGGAALLDEGLAAAGPLTAAGVRVLAEVFPARMRRGAGVPPVPRLAYLAEQAQAQLAGLRHLVLAGATAPVSFFAYPGRPSVLTPPDCQVHVLATPGQDAAGAVRELAAMLDGPTSAPPSGPAAPGPPASGALDPRSLAAVVAATLPEGAIVSDEAQTSGLFLPAATASAPPHDVLTLTGGAIGQGLPVAVGAAVACPDRPVLALEADGSAMYTLDALHTMAREGLDVTVVVLANRAYAILAFELARVGADRDSPAARRMLDLSSPPLDFVALGRGMGVPSTRATTAEELTAQLRAAYAEPGPHLIEAVVAGTGDALSRAGS